MKAFASKNMMSGMYMCRCRMCMSCHAFQTDEFSISAEGRPEISGT